MKYIAVLLGTARTVITFLGEDRQVQGLAPEWCGREAE